jgi:Na+/proline symporter
MHAHGLGAHAVEPFAYGICLVLTGLVFAAPMWRLGITTVADLFRRRFGPRVETFAAILLIPTSVLWAAAQVRAFGQVLSSASDLQIETAITIAAAIAITYTVFGGLLADVITDAVQGGALLIGLLVLTIAAIDASGGLQGAIEHISSARPAGQPDVPGFWETVEMWAIPIIGSVTAQEVISRTLAARSPGTARRAGILGGGMYLLIGLMPVGLGLLAIRAMPDIEDSDQVLSLFAMEYLPTFGYVLFAGALVSAILSTVDSALLVAASIASRNVVLAGRDDVSERTRLITARIGVAVFGVMAWWLAHGAERVYDLVQEASGFGSAGIVVAVTFGLFTRFGSTGAASAALAGGIVSWVIGAYVVEDFAYPYLTSCVVAISAYLSVGAIETAAARAAATRERELSVLRAREETPTRRFAERRSRR